jgi:cephalosporin-C deacetylase
VPLTDLPFAELVQYRSQAQPPSDLHAFWATTLVEARAAAWAPKYEPVDNGLRLVRTWDVVFSGFAGDPIHAWLHVPGGASDLVPVVVRNQGYGGGRGLSHQVSLYPLAGYACLEVDTRGQGSGYLTGDTPDPQGSGPAHPGYLTRGILDPQTYYYRRVFTDAVMAVEAVKALPGVDASRVAVAGGSQGGGISIAVASLRDDLAAVLTDVPFLSDFHRGCEIAVNAPYTELTKYLSIHRDQVDQVFDTLAYFDVSVLAASAQAPALFSVALMDQTCPPSTVYAAYNAYGGSKEIRVYGYNDHEGGQGFQDGEQLTFLRTHLGAGAQG